MEMVDIKSSLLGVTIEGGWPKPIVLAHDPADSVSPNSNSLEQC